MSGWNSTKYIGGKEIQIYMQNNEYVFVLCLCFKSKEDAFILKYKYLVVPGCEIKWLKIKLEMKEKIIKVWRKLNFIYKKKKGVTEYT